MRRAGRSLACAAVWVACFAVMPASAQELSEKATRAFMEYAWSLTPEAFTKPNGETIQIDKTKKDQVMIPLDVAREVIHAGRLSAHAQVCELTQEQADNHNSLMRRETLSKKWTPQQLVYINQLHLTVVMMLTGRVKLVEKGDDKGADKDDKEVVIEQGAKQTQTCTAEQKQKVKELITAYVKSGPPAPAPTTAAAAPTSTDQPAASPAPPATSAAAPAQKAAPPAAAPAAQK